MTDAKIALKRLNYLLDNPDEIVMKDLMSDNDFCFTLLNAYFARYLTEATEPCVLTLGGIEVTREVTPIYSKEIDADVRVHFSWEAIGRRWHVVHPPIN